MVSLCIFLIAGCYSGGNHAVNNKEEAWNFHEGYIIAKEIQNFGVLVVKDQMNIKNKSVNEIMRKADPHAIWISTDKEIITRLKLVTK